MAGCHGRCVVKDKCSRAENGKTRHPITPVTVGTRRGEMGMGHRGWEGPAQGVQGYVASNSHPQTHTHINTYTYGWIYAQRTHCDSSLPLVIWGHARHSRAILVFTSPNFRISEPMNIVNFDWCWLQRYNKWMFIKKQMNDMTINWFGLIWSMCCYNSYESLEKQRENRLR